MKSFVSIFAATLRIFLRDRMLLFLTLIFPLTIGLIFGFVFGSSGGSYSINVGIIEEDGAVREALSEVKEVRITEYSTGKELEEAVMKGEVSAGFEIDGSTIVAYFNRSRVLADPFARNLPQKLKELLSIPEEDRDFGIKIKSLNVKSGAVKATNTSYIIPGIVAVSLFSGGVFSAIELFSRYKERGILKRVKVTGLNPFVFVVASIAGRGIVSGAAAVLLFLVMSAVFNAHFLVNLPLFFGGIVFGTLLMLALGTLISVITSTTTSANEIATVLMTLMFFFAGVYFPLEFLPRYLRTFGLFLPLYHLAATMRMAVGVEKIQTGYILTFFAVVAVVFTVMFTLASKLLFVKES